MKTRLKKLIAHMALAAFLCNAVPANMWDMLPAASAAGTPTPIVSMFDYTLGGGRGLGTVSWVVENTVNTIKCSFNNGALATCPSVFPHGVIDLGVHTFTTIAGEPQYKTRVDSMRACNDAGLGTQTCSAITYATALQRANSLPSPYTRFEMGGTPNPQGKFYTDASGGQLTWSGTFNNYYGDLDEVSFIPYWSIDGQATVTSTMCKIWIAPKNIPESTMPYALKSTTYPCGTGTAGIKLSTVMLGVGQTLPKGQYEVSFTNCHVYNSQTGCSNPSTILFNHTPNLTPAQSATAPVLNSLGIIEDYAPTGGASFDPKFSRGIPGAMNVSTAENIIVGLTGQQHRVPLVWNLSNYDAGSTCSVTVNTGTPTVTPCAPFIYYDNYFTNFATTKVLTFKACNGTQCTQGTSRVNIVDSAAATDAPVIFKQPSHVSVSIGQTATFTVGAYGSNLTYQWFDKFGAAIPGATAASYTTPAITASGSGNKYKVSISNGSGTVTSTAGILVIQSVSGVLAYVASYGSNTVNVIDTTNNSLLYSVSNTEYPMDITVHPDGSKVFASGLTTHKIPAINTISRQIAHTTDMGSTWINDVIFRGNRVFAASNGDKKIYELNVNDGSIIRSYPLTNGPIKLFNSARWLFATTGTEIVYLDPGNYQSTIPVTSLPYGIVSSPDGLYAYVANSTSLLKVNTETKVITTISVPGLSGNTTNNSLSISPDGSRVYVVSESTDKVYIIDTLSNSNVGNISIASDAKSAQVTSDGNQLYVMRTGFIDVYSTSTNALVTSISLPSSAVSSDIAMSTVATILSDTVAPTVGIQSLNNITTGYPLNTISVNDNGTPTTMSMTTSGVDILTNSSDNAGGSGINSNTYTVNVNGTVTSSLPSIFRIQRSQLSPGINTITISVKDIAGNSASETRKLYLDDQPPVFGWSINGVPSAMPNSAWTKTPVQVILSCTDNTPGCFTAATYQNVSAGAVSCTPTSTYTYTSSGSPSNTLTFSQPTSICAKAQDVLGTPSITNTYTLNVDTVLPTASIDNFITTTAGKTISQSGGVWYTNDKTPKMQFTTADTISGIASQTMKIDTGTPVNITGSEVILPTLSDGAHTITLTVTDNAGNISTASKSISVSTAGPVLTGTLRMPLLEGNKMWGDLNYAPLILPTGSNISKMVFKVINKTEGNIQEPLLVQISNLAGNSGTHRSGNEITLVKDANGDMEQIGLMFNHDRNAGGYSQGITEGILPRATLAGAQITYRAELTVYDSFGNTTTQILDDIKFDTLAPDFTSLTTFYQGSPVSSQISPILLNGINYIVYKDTAARYGFTALEATNSNTWSGQISNVIRNGSTIIEYFSAYTNSSKEAYLDDAFTLPGSNFKGPLTFTISDSGGNTSTRTIQFWHDPTPPVINTLNQALTTPGLATKDVTLNMNFTDNVALTTNVLISTNGYNYYLTIPAALLSADKKTISGQWTIPYASIPQLKEGTDTLQVKIFDAANNEAISGNITTLTDHTSPTINESLSNYSITPSVINLNLNVTDRSPLRTFFETTDLGKEATASAITRMLSIANIALTGRTLPYNFTITDDINTPAAFSVQNGMTFGSNTSGTSLNVASTYAPNNLPGGSSTTFTVTPPAGFGSPVNQTFAGALGNISINEAPKGTYGVQAVVTIPNKPTATFTGTITNTADLIGPKITAAPTLSATNAGKIMNQDGSSRYFTNDTSASASFSFTPYTEQSFPLTVKVNGAQAASYASIPTGTQTVSFSLSNPNNPVAYVIEISDAAGNKITYNYTVIMDNQTSNPVSGTTSNVALYEGTSGTFVPSSSLLLPYSSAVSAYLSDTSLAAFVVNAEDNWGNAPKVVIKKGAAVIVPSTTLTAIAGSTTNFTFTKKDIAVDVNATANYTVEITDIAGNVKSVPFSLKHYTSNPSIGSFTVNGGDTTVNTPTVTATVSTAGSSTLTYEVIVDGAVVSTGSLGNTSVTNAPISIPLGTPGTHTVKVVIIDELGHRTETSVQTVIYDTTAPTVSSMVLTAPANKKVLLQNNKWYTSSPTPALKVIMADAGGSNIDTSKSKIQLNGGVITAYTDNMTLPTLSAGTNDLLFFTADFAGNTVSSQITIILDTYTPTALGGITVDTISDLQNPNNSIKYNVPGAKDADTPANIGTVGLESVEIKLLSSKTGAAVSLTGKVVPTGFISLDPTDSTRLLIAPDTNGSLPAILTFSNLDKTVSGEQTAYTLQLSAKDKLGNTSVPILSAPASFDTLAPTFVGEVSIKDMPLRAADGKSWYILNQSTQSIITNLQENTNSGRTKTMPISLKAYAGAARDLSTVSTFMVNTTVSSEGSMELPITFPANYGGEVTFVAVDNAGNISTTKTINVYTDTTGPTIPAGQSAVVQVPSAANPTKELTLALRVSDSGMLSHRVTVAYGSTLKDLTLPDSVFQDSDRLISGNWVLTETDLPNFPQGSQNDLRVTFYDISNHAMVAGPVATNVDWKSPVVTNVSYAFKDNKTKLDLTFTVQDTSKTQLLAGVNVLFSEGTVSTASRTYTVRDIVLSGSSPYTFVLSDSLNPSTSIMVQDGFSLTRGAANASGIIPVQFVVNPAGTSRTVNLQITGPAGIPFTTLNQSFTTATGTINLNRPPKGTYVATATVIVDGKETTYEQNISITEDLIPITLGTTTLTAKTAGKSLGLNDAGTVYVTNDTVLSLNYTFEPSVEQSFPVKVLVNGVEKANFASALPTASQTLDIALSTPNTQQTYQVRFQDAAGNNTDLAYTVVQDTTAPVSGTVGESFTTLYQGNAGAFSPTPDILLKKSTVANEYLTSGSYAGIVVEAQDNWGSPTVSVKVNGNYLVSNASAILKTGTTDTYTYQKGNLTLTPDSTTQVIVEVKDRAGNISSSTYNVRQVTAKPQITALNVNNGKIQTSSTSVAGIISVTSTSAVKYEVLLGASIIGSGTFSQANPMNAPIQFTVQNQGNNSMKVRVTDELGNTAESNTFTIYLDTTPPQIDTVTVKATQPQTKAEIKNNKWYTNDVRPLIEVAASDAGSGLGAGATYSFSLNGGTAHVISSNSYQLESSLINGDNTVTVIIKDVAGATVSKVVNIIYDTGAPEFTGSMTIKNIQDLPNPNHFVDIAIPGVKDKDTGGYGVSGIDHMDMNIIDVNTGTAVSLAGKVTESATVDVSQTDPTVLTLKQDANGNWPVSIIFTNLPKKTAAGVQIIYRARLTAADLVGNTSSQTMDGISFDTKVPSFTETPDFAPLNTKNFDGINWTISKNKQINVSFTSLEEVDTGRALSLPLTLTVKSGATVLGTKSFSQIGRSTAQFDLPANFKNTVEFTLTDAAGNISAPYTASLWWDTTAPTAIAGNTTAIVQELGGLPGTNNLPLLIKAQDAGGMAKTALVEYSGKSMTLPIPASLFKDQDRQIDGIWTLTDQDVPEFPQGATSVLKITLSDTAGNLLPVNNIPIKYDSESPKINDMTYSFKNNNTQMDLSIAVSDVSLLSIRYNNQEIQKETSATNKDRTLTLSNVTLVGTGPYIFTLRDGINPDTQVTISDGLSLSFGAPSNETVPLNYVLSGSGDLTQAQAAFTISGPAGFTTFTKTQTGKTGSIVLTSPLKGQYTITTVVSIAGQNNVTYNNSLIFNQDIIAPKINDSRVGFDTVGDAPLGNTNGTFYTSASAIRMKYAFNSYIEQSFPVDVYVNRVKQTSFSVLPTDDQFVNIPLVNPNTTQSYSVEFVDAAGNTTKKDFTAVQDTVSPTHPTGTTMIKSYIGSTNFVANDSLLMKKSGVAEEYVTKNPMAAFVIMVEDEWGNTPMVRILKDGTEILPQTSMTNVANKVFSLTKKDAALTENALNSFRIEISDIAGNSYSEVILVRHDNSGPVITSINFNDGKEETNKTNNFGSVSVDATSSLTYKVLVDGQSVSNGVWSTADVSNAPLAFALAAQGSHNVIFSVTDELGQTTSSAAVVLTLDSIKPEAKLTVKDMKNVVYLSQKIDNTTTADPVLLTATRDRVSGSGMKLEVNEGRDVHFPISILTDSTQKPLAALYAQTPAASLADANAQSSTIIPLLSEGMNTLSVMLKDTFGNARSASLQIIRDTEGPSTTASVAETPEGNLKWDWNYADALNTPIDTVRIEVKNTTLGTIIYPKTSSPANFGTTTKSWTLSAADVRRGETYAMTIIATDNLGNASLARTISITPRSNTYDAFDPLDKDPTPIPWQNDPSITEVTVTLTQTNGTVYTAVIPKTPTLDLETFIDTASNGTKDKLPVGTYDVVITPVTTNSNVVPAKVETTITISPYYMDANGDLNGDGFGGGLSDYILYKEAKRIGNIYALVKVGILTEAEKKQDEERKARGTEIENIIINVMTTKLDEFMKK
ncbi:MAG: hypothetical protein ACK4NC_06920 [Candidatus Gracilibacteria bacterium]